MTCTVSGLQVSVHGVEAETVRVAALGLGKVRVVELKLGATGIHIHALLPSVEGRERCIVYECT